MACGSIRAVTYAIALHRIFREPPGRTKVKENTDAMLAATVVNRLATAKQELMEQMLAAGLEPRKGWRISEELRHTVGGTEWLFRPIHMKDPSPPDFHVIVRIDHNGRPV